VSSFLVIAGVQVTKQNKSTPIPLQSIEKGKKKAACTMKNLCKWEYRGSLEEMWAEIPSSRFGTRSVHQLSWAMSR